MFKGSIPALITPMTDECAIDLKSLRELVLWHIDSGSSGLVVCGTTGESATLSLDEQALVLSEVIEVSNGKIPIIAGTGSPDTAKAIKATKQAEKLGADAALIVTPYYLKTTQQGLIEHYKTIAKATSLPIILYNVPGRTCVDLLPETALELAEVDNIIGIKEATGDIARVTFIKDRNPDFMVLTGDDGTAADAMLLGAEGVISVTSNVIPQQMAELCRAIENDDQTSTDSLKQITEPMHNALFLEPSPIPVKFLLSYLGKCENILRLPLVPLTSEHEKIVISAYEEITS